jgi:peptide/nickel transport system ATP-binding protein
MHPLLRIENLEVGFKTGEMTVTALNGINLEVNKGEIVAIVGESGSGKSVTALSILQLIPSPPAVYGNGKIWFSENGSDTIDLLEKNSRSLQEIRGNKIAMIFQEPMTSLNPVLTCGNQVMEAITLHKKLAAKEAKARTIEWFTRVQLPDPAGVFNRYPHQLSGGQKQRVMIAMAMCCEPALLICDEPTTALDVTVQKTILELIRGLQRETGMGVIFITHDFGVVAAIADRAVVMYKGQVVEEQAVKQLFQHPQHSYTKALLACRPANHPRGKRLPVVSDFLDSGEINKQIIPTVSKLPLKEHTSDLLIEVKNLSVWFPAKKTFFGKPLQFIHAVDEVSFDVYDGETLGLVGESGCGKTTLGRTLLRLIEPTSGQILYKGKDLATMRSSELRTLRKNIQIVFQDPYSSLNPRITIGSAIAEPLKVHGLVDGERKRKDNVVQLLEKVSLSADHYNRYPHEFSGGQRQRIVIARALALNPSFIVCDESVSALDVSVQAQVLNLLNDLKKEYGFTVIFISHDLAVVRYISDRIMVMNKGRIVETGDADSIYISPKSDYTKNLIAAIPNIS